ncbi:DNA topoisomerase IB [Candidatus Saccharibacteria bacterium]|nr:DNA topoisomerase IB [Candidatus Saccharibacteria bacterium]
MTHAFITRKRSGDGFDYFQHDDRITDESLIERLNKLAIPPAWKDVQISPSPRSKIQATGYDDAGRKQAIYSQAHHKRQERLKFDRILRFASALPSVRQQIARDLKADGLHKDKVMACVVKLMDEAYFRVGNEEYARQHQHYGITTMRHKHTHFEGHSVTFHFIGKSGQEHEQTIDDKQLTDIIRQLDELPGYEIFKYYDHDGTLHDVSSRDVNDYIKLHMGEEFTAKDFRTWGGTLLAMTELAASQQASSEAERHRIVTECIKKVAERLGNTPAIARKSYVDPRIINAYMKSDAIHKVTQTVRGMRPRRYMSASERGVLELLSSVD